MRSGTTCEIDAKGIRKGSTGFLIVECRRYTSSKQNQGNVGALAYRILDTGAEGGVVSPLGLQEGAQSVASAENILSVQLNDNSTRHEYVLRFLNKLMGGLSDTMTLKDSVELQVMDKNGNVIRRISSE